MIIEELKQMPIVTVEQVLRFRDAALKEIADLEDDARRYKYIRDNQTWHRYDDYSLVGCKFDYDADFQCRPMLDYNIDKAIARKVT